MTAKIKYKKTGKTQEIEITEVFYTSEKIVLFSEKGFASYFHGIDNVEIEIKKNE